MFQISFEVQEACHVLDVRFEVESGWVQIPLLRRINGGTAVGMYCYGGERRKGESLPPAAGNGYQLPPMGMFYVVLYERI